MRLINVKTRQLEEFNKLTVPKYAILSHTWDHDHEVTFQEMSTSVADHHAAQHLPSTNSTGWQKIDMTCRKAAEDGLDYVWVDTCCIDKSSSAELSEAINSMFLWYARAAVCYVYLVDVLESPRQQDQQPQDGASLESSISASRWFTRSWTLQELLAPRRTRFFNQRWELCFEGKDAAPLLSSITGVGVDILQHRRSLSEVSVAQKMSWTAGRQATRAEDEAYSLLGIFEINMPMLYGEGRKAFLRLQSEIISSHADPSVLAWTIPSCQMAVVRDSEAGESLFHGFMASSPVLFRACSQMRRLPEQHMFEFSMSNRGIKLRARFRLCSLPGVHGPRLILPVCISQNNVAAIEVRNVGRGCFVRENANSLVQMDACNVLQRFMLEPHLLTELPTRGKISANGRRLILDPRERILELKTSPGMEMHRRWPWQMWDERTNIFIASEGAHEDMSWAAVGIAAVIPPSFHDGKTPKLASLLFYAFGWNLRPAPDATPRCTLFVLPKGNYTPEYDSIEQFNEKAAMQDWRAWFVAMRLVRKHIPEQSAVVVGCSGRRKLLAAYAIDLVEDTSLSPRKFWRVTFSWEVVDCNDNQHYPVDRGWKGTIWDPDLRNFANDGARAMPRTQHNPHL